MGVLNVLGQAATVVGKGYEGYGQDEDSKVKDALAQAKAAEDAKRNAVLNRVAMAGIDPTVQGDLSRSRSAGTTEGANPGLASRERLLGAIRTTNKVADINATAAPTANAEALKIDTTAGPEAHAAGLKAKELLPVNVEQAKQESANAAANAAPTIVPTDKGVFKVPRTGPASAVVDENGKPVIKSATGTTGGTLRGLGQVFTAGSGIGSVHEMGKANANMKAFEKGFLSDVPTSQLDAVDRFRQKLANEIQTHGVLSAATASEAERELAASNPDLAVYGRNLAQWIVGDLNVSKGGTDEKARRDEAVSGLKIPLSSMPLPQRVQYINQIWEGRDARYSGLETSAKTAQAILDRVSGSVGNDATPKLGSREAAGAHLKAQGKTDAEILKTLGPP